jgi:hypothetical protein
LMFDLDANVYFCYFLFTVSAELGFLLMDVEWLAAPAYCLLSLRSRYNMEFSAATPALFSAKKRNCQMN